ncbi:MAG TPA: hypothetical protein VN802_03040 [Stellaceae bacterium]|nr:hypothetical protein [Stellaceae bacterium]
MPSTLVTNIGTFFTGDIAAPMAPVRSLLIADGRIAALDPPGDVAADRVLDAKGGAVLPGLVDGHVHPVFGEWTPTQDAAGWIGNYLHGAPPPWCRPASCTRRGSTTTISRPIS